MTIENISWFIIIILVSFFLIINWSNLDRNTLNYIINQRVYSLLISLCCFVVLPYLIISNTYNDISLNNQVDNIVNYQYNNVGIITIATGGYSAHKLVETLRTNGNWHKNIYIYSDPCTPIENNTKILKINEVVKTPIQSKLYKMEILKNTTEEYILFLDSDIYVNRPINDLFRIIGLWKKDCDAYMTYDIWYSKKFMVNGGLILVKRNKSEKFLMMWKNAILNKNYTKKKDQPALKYLIDNKFVNVCMIPNNIVYYVPDNVGKLYTQNKAIFHHYLSLKTNTKKCTEKFD